MRHLAIKCLRILKPYKAVILAIVTLLFFQLSFGHALASNNRPNLFDVFLLINYCSVDANYFTPENNKGTGSFYNLYSNNELTSDSVEVDILVANADTENNGLDDKARTTSGYPDLGESIDYRMYLPYTNSVADNSSEIDFRGLADDMSDSDNDGIADAVDLDDDNDGILDTVECGSADPINLVSNGDFSSFYFDGWTPDGSNWQEPGSGLYAFYEEYSTGTKVL